MCEHPRVPADLPLYDILNEFQKGSSHMAAVVKVKGTMNNPQIPDDVEKFNENRITSGNSQLTTPLLTKGDDKSDSVLVDVDKHLTTIGNKLTTLQPNGIAANTLPHFSEDVEEGEVIGIITLEDVFEELLQVSVVFNLDMKLFVD